MLEKLSKMSARQAMIDLVGVPPQHGEQPRWLANVAKKIGASYRTARSLWNDEIKNPDQHWAVKRLRREAELAKARREADALASQFESIAGSLNAKDQDFYSADIAALIDAARVIRNVDRT
jgi:hypothetical protein